MEKNKYAEEKDTGLMCSRFKVFTYYRGNEIERSLPNNINYYGYPSYLDRQPASFCYGINAALEDDFKKTAIG